MTFCTNQRKAYELMKGADENSEEIREAFFKNFTIASTASLNVKRVIYVLMSIQHQAVRVVKLI